PAVEDRGARVQRRGGLPTHGRSFWLPAPSLYKSADVLGGDRGGRRVGCMGRVMEVHGPVRRVRGRDKGRGKSENDREQTPSTRQSEGSRSCLSRLQRRSRAARVG